VFTLHANSISKYP